MVERSTYSIQSNQLVLRKGSAILKKGQGPKINNILCRYYITTRPSNISTTPYFFPTESFLNFSSYNNLLDPNFYWLLIAFIIVAL
tara:strand:+ start:100 stop:357 length:258 start_codon:yes stop_codon:yes gene_type:complete